MFGIPMGRRRGGGGGWGWGKGRVRLVFLTPAVFSAASRVLLPCWPCWERFATQVGLIDWSGCEVCRSRGRGGGEGICRVTYVLGRAFDWKQKWICFIILLWSFTLNHRWGRWWGSWHSVYQSIIFYCVNAHVANSTPTCNTKHNMHTCNVERRNICNVQRWSTSEKVQRARYRCQITSHLREHLHCWNRTVVARLKKVTDTTRVV